MTLTKAETRPERWHFSNVFADSLSKGNSAYLRNATFTNAKALWHLPGSLLRVATASGAAARSGSSITGRSAKYSSAIRESNRSRGRKT